MNIFARTFYSREVYELGKQFYTNKYNMMKENINLHQEKFNSLKEKELKPYLGKKLNPYNNMVWHLMNLRAKSETVLNVMAALGNVLEEELEHELLLVTSKLEKEFQKLYVNLTNKDKENIVKNVVIITSLLYDSSKTLQRYKSVALEMDKIRDIEIDKNYELQQKMAHMKTRSSVSDNSNCDETDNTDYEGMSDDELERLANEIKALKTLDYVDTSNYSGPEYDIE